MHDCMHVLFLHSTYKCKVQAVFFHRPIIGWILKSAACLDINVHGDTPHIVASLTCHIMRLVISFPVYCCADLQQMQHFSHSLHNQSNVCFCPICIAFLGRVIFSPGSDLVMEIFVLGAKIHTIVCLYE